jgi:hypothetical protein
MGVATSMVRSTVSPVLGDSSGLAGRVASGGTARAAARRRRVVTALSGVTVLCLVGALLSGASLAWWLVALLLPVTVAYLGLSLHLRRRAAEREMGRAFRASVISTGR